MQIEPKSSTPIISLDNGVSQSGFFKVADGIFKANDSRWFILKGKIVNPTETAIDKVYLHLRLDAAHILKWFVCETISEHSEKSITIDIDTLTEFGYKLNHMFNLEQISLEMAYLRNHTIHRVAYKLIKTSAYQYEWIKTHAGY